jgi:hypothetical protein
MILIWLVTACDVVLFIQLRNPRRWMHASRKWLVQNWLPRLALVFSHIFSYFLGWSQFLSWWKHWWCWIRRTLAPWTSNKKHLMLSLNFDTCFNFAIVLKSLMWGFKASDSTIWLYRCFAAKYNYWYVLKNTQVGKAAPVSNKDPQGLTCSTKRFVLSIQGLLSILSVLTHILCLLCLVHVLEFRNLHWRKMAKISHAMQGQEQNSIGKQCCQIIVLLIACQIVKDCMHAFTWSSRISLVKHRS